jgi:hypothetical protein
MLKTARIEGLGDCIKSLHQLDAAIQRDVGEYALDGAMDVFVGAISNRAPVSPRASDATPGSLKASVRKRKARATKKYLAKGEININDPAAAPLEFGLSSRDYPAEPFARPAVDDARGHAGEVVASRVRERVEHGPWVKGRG